MNIPADELPRVALQAACRAFRVPDVVMQDDGRSQPAAWVRQVSWWLLDDMLGWTHGLIARYAGRDRSAISHGVHTVVDRISTEPQIMERMVTARALFYRDTEPAAKRR